MIENNAIANYDNAINSYTALSISTKIRGHLIEKDEKNLTLDIGNSECLHIELKEDIELKPGTTVLLDRNNIASSRKSKLKEDIPVGDIDIEKYTQSLESFGVEISEPNIKILSQMEHYGVPITEENFHTYSIAKNSLDEIASSLDYNSAIKLAEMDIDVQNDSIQKIAQALKDISEEKDGFDLSKLFGNKKLSTEDAEEIAQKLYGSRMGKDITDIIKSFHEKRISITKKNVEKINDLFYKLNSLKDIEDTTFIDVLKSDLDINIDNLYRVKTYVTSDTTVDSDKDIDQFNIKNLKSYGFNSYEFALPEKPKVTTKELRLLEEDIVDLIELSELEPSAENIKLSKEFIKRDIPLSAENLTLIQDMKKALAVISSELDYESASLLLKAGVDIEQEDLMSLASKLKELQIDSGVDGEKKEISVTNKSIESIAADVPDIAQEDLISLPSKLKEFPIDSGVDEVADGENSDVVEVLNKLESLKHIEEKDLLTLVEKNIDFKISKIENVLSSGRALLSESILPTDYTPSAVVRSIENISSVFSTIETLDINTLAFQLKQNIPMTLMNLKERGPDTRVYGLEDGIQSSEFIQPEPLNANSDIKTSYIKTTERQVLSLEDIQVAFSKNGVPYTRPNIERVSSVYNGYNNLRENLTQSMVSTSLSQNISLENMDISLSSDYVNRYAQNSSEYSLNYPAAAERFIESLNSDVKSILSNSENSLMLLLRNKKPFSLEEVKKTSFLFENREQLGHKIAELSSILDTVDDVEISKQLDLLKQSVASIPKSMKQSIPILEENSQEIEKCLRDIQERAQFLDEGSQSSLKDTLKEISKTIDESRQNSVENKILQFPLYMNGQFTNLNMYFKERNQRESHKNPGDISAIMSIETANLGNLNINLDVEQKTISLKIGLEDSVYQQSIERHSESLRGILEALGYGLEKLEFYSEVEHPTFSAPESSGEKLFPSSGNLDLKV